MTTLKTALIVALSVAAAAACVPVGEAPPYAAMSTPAPSMISYPEIAQSADADGHVFEYH